MTQDLYKIGRIINNDKFILIVEAGMLKYAQGLALGGTLTNEKNFAIWVLKNPMQRENSMISLVAADAAVLATVTMTDADYASVDAVQDADVMAAITARWSLVSTKYPATTPM